MVILEIDPPYLVTVVNSHTDTRTRTVDSTSVECLFSITPLPRVTA